MKDKFGRTYTVSTLSDGRKKYKVNGSFELILSADEDALARIESMPPSASEYEQPDAMRGRDISQFSGIIDYDFKNSDVGEQAEIILACDVAHAKDFFRAEIFKGYKARMKEIFDLYPTYEPQGWFKKDKQAESWLTMYFTNDTEGMAAAIALAATPIKTQDPVRCKHRMLFREAAPNRVATVDDIPAITELAVKIMLNGEFFEEYYGDVSWHKTSLVRELAECETAEDFLALDVEFSAVKTLSERL